MAGEHHVLKVMLVLLSRSITIQGNLTDERVQFLASCQGASASEGREQFVGKSIMDEKQCSYCSMICGMVDFFQLVCS